MADDDMLRPDAAEQTTAEWFAAFQRAVDAFGGLPPLTHFVMHGRWP